MNPGSFCLASSTKVAVFIGRFQPAHRGHVELIRQCLRSADYLLVIVGSAFRAASPRNPFTWQEREVMLRAAVDAGDQQRVHCLPLRDWFDTRRWADDLAMQVNAYCRQNWRAEVEVLLANKFQQPHVNRHPDLARWSRLDLPRTPNIASEAIRDTLFNQVHRRKDVENELDTKQLESVLPASTLQFLRQWQSSPQFVSLAEEWLNLHCYKRAWDSAPYPPIFVTADSVVVCQDRVLLVQRAKAPGKGLWALPGGFIEVDEPIQQSALRELVEETCIDVPVEELERSCRSSFVCDHPNRSERGRIITHAFHFDLGQRTLPKVQAADDAIDTKWVPLSQLVTMEDRFHDDHFAILDRCLGLL